MAENLYENKFMDLDLYSRILEEKYTNIVIIIIVNIMNNYQIYVAKVIAFKVNY